MTSWKSEYSVADINNHDGFATRYFRPVSEAPRKRLDLRWNFTRRVIAGCKIYVVDQDHAGCNPDRGAEFWEDDLFERFVDCLEDRWKMLLRHGESGGSGAFR